MTLHKGPQWHNTMSYLEYETFFSGENESNYDYANYEYYNRELLECIYQFMASPFPPTGESWILLVPITMTS